MRSTRSLLQFAALLRTSYRRPCVDLPTLRSAQLAYVLGAAASYEATSSARARLVAEAFWRSLARGFMYLTGGSSWQEQWSTEAPGVGATLLHRGSRNWAAHDHQESCVTHNSMILARRLLCWGATKRSEWEIQLDSYADWLDAAMHNGVLGTQRGTQPGAMLYMMPLGAGVRKGGGGHGYSHPENHFWCCMGSAIEAFTKLHSSVFFRRTAAGANSGLHELYVLQLIPAELRWSEVGCRVVLQADQPGDVGAEDPLFVELNVHSIVRTGSTAEKGSCMLRIAIRVPSWAHAAQARVRLFPAADGTTYEKGSDRKLRPGSLFKQLVRAGDILQLYLWPKTTLRRADAEQTDTQRLPSTRGARRAQQASVLASLMHGPLVMVALTGAERLLRMPSDWDGRFDAHLTPLASEMPTRHRALGSASASVTRWVSSVPQAARDELVTMELLRGKGCQKTELVLSHTGEGTSIVAAPRPRLPPVRPGILSGSDEAHAATWRVTASPVTSWSMSRAPALRLSRATDGTLPVVIEAFDRPGMVLTLGPEAHGRRSLNLQPALPSGMDETQRWWLRRADIASASTASCADSIAKRNGHAVSLQSLAEARYWVLPPKNGATGTIEAMALTNDLERAATFVVAPPIARFPPLSFWAHSNVTCPSHNLAIASSCRKHYLMVPLRDVVDETYSSTFCVLPSASLGVPRFCH